MLNTDVEFDLNGGLIVKSKDTIYIKELNALVQEIKIESITAEGDLWYDQEYGWSLQDFIHRTIDEMLELEIYQRVKDKLSKREEVDKDSVEIELEQQNDGICIKLKFTALGEEVSLSIMLDRVKVEVKIGG